MTEEPEHPDAEFERLRARIAAELRVPEGETYAQHAEREQRLRDLFDEVWRNAYPDWDNPAARPPEPLPAPNWIVFDPPLVATPPAWRTPLVSYHAVCAPSGIIVQADRLCLMVHRP